MTRRPSQQSERERPSKRTKMNTVSWGSYLGAHKTGSAIDQEAERIDRQKAAFGHDTIARLKDLNVLIIGIGGVGKWILRYICCCCNSQQKNRKVHFIVLNCI